MNVLYLTHRLPYSPNRGDRIRAYHMIREMARFATVRLFSLVHDHEEKAHAARMESVARVEVAEVTRMRNAIAGAFSLATRRPLTHCLLNAPEAQSRIKALVRDARPDVVVAYCSGVAQFALRPPLSTFPLVLDLVDVDSAKWERMAAASAPPLKWIYQRETKTLGVFEAEASRRAAEVLVVNERERETLRALAPTARVTVIENGIDLNAFRNPGEPAADPLVVFCGVMDYYPNEEGVLWFAREVWPLVVRRRPSARFRIVGARPTSAVSALTQNDPSIEVTGTVPAVQPHLWASAVSVAPLRLAQGLQNKVLEALAAGLPAVVTTAVHAGLPSEARPACAVADDADTFADNVIRLLDLSPAERKLVASQVDLATLSWERRLTGLRDVLMRAAVSNSASNH